MQEHPNLHRPAGSKKVAETQNRRNLMSFHPTISSSECSFSYGMIGLDLPPNMMVETSAELERNPTTNETHRLNIPKNILLENELLWMEEMQHQLIGGLYQD